MCINRIKIGGFSAYGDRLTLCLLYVTMRAATDLDECVNGRRQEGWTFQTPYAHGRSLSDWFTWMRQAGCAEKGKAGATMVAQFLWDVGSLFRHLHSIGVAFTGDRGSSTSWEKLRGRILLLPDEFDVDRLNREWCDCLWKSWVMISETFYEVSFFVVRTRSTWHVTVAICYDLYIRDSWREI